MSMKIRVYTGAPVNPKGVTVKQYFHKGVTNAVLSMDLGWTGI